jgi:hypothetical protein
MERTKVFPASPEDQQQALELDELDVGWPKMTIDMMLDVVTAAIGICNKVLHYRAALPSAPIEPENMTTNCERSPFIRVPS